MRLSPWNRGANELRGESRRRSRPNEWLQLTACMHHRIGGAHSKTFPSRRSLRPQLSARPLSRHDVACLELSLYGKEGVTSGGTTRFTE